MTDEELTANFQPMLDALDQDFHWMMEHQPLLAHYTSIDVVEKILRNEEIWFSNPLFMNDLEELRFGLFQGREAFMTNDAVAIHKTGLSRYNVRSTITSASLIPSMLSMCMSFAFQNTVRRTQMAFFPCGELTEAKGTVQH
jgi:hypothetical protein